MKTLGVKGTAKAIALMNRSNSEVTFDLDAKRIGVSSAKKVRDLWLHKDLGRIGKTKRFLIRKHGIVLLKTI